jgi:hypothetical protein
MAGAARHARRLYRKAFRRLRRIEAEVEHLHDLEEAGEGAETPAIAVLGVLLFLLPAFLFLAGCAFAAYYLAT